MAEMLRWTGNRDDPASRRDLLQRLQRRLLRRLRQGRPAAAADRDGRHAPRRPPGRRHPDRAAGPYPQRRRAQRRVPAHAGTARADRRGPEPARRLPRGAAPDVRHGQCQHLDPDRGRSACDRRDSRHRILGRVARRSRQVHRRRAAAGPARRRGGGPGRGRDGPRNGPPPRGGRDRPGAVCARAVCARAVVPAVARAAAPLLLQAPNAAPPRPPAPANARLTTYFGEVRGIALSWSKDFDCVLARSTAREFVSLRLCPERYGLSVAVDYRDGTFAPFSEWVPDFEPDGEHHHRRGRDRQPRRQPDEADPLRPWRRQVQRHALAADDELRRHAAEIVLRMGKVALAMRPPQDFAAPMWSSVVARTGGARRALRPARGPDRCPRPVRAMPAPAGSWSAGTRG